VHKDGGGGGDQNNVVFKTKKYTMWIELENFGPEKETHFKNKERIINEKYKK
jgi:hypothetical protein